MDKFSEQGLLEVLSDFDEHGGASMGLTAWELFTNEQQLLSAWNHATEAGWLERAGIDPVYGEQLYRLTPAGWEAHRRLGQGGRAAGD